MEEQVKNQVSNTQPHLPVSPNIPPSNTKTSDVPAPTTEPFLNEPKKPSIEDYDNPENYEFAMTEYRKKLSIYTARKQWLKQRKLEEEANGINYPDYCYFVNLDEYGKPLEPFKPAKVAQWLRDNDHFKTDRKTDILYFGDVKTGKWTEQGETALKEIMGKIMGEWNKEIHYRNVLHCLKSVTYEDIRFSGKIACENGLLDVENQTLTPFNLDEMAFHTIPVMYDPTAQCPNWKEFIKQVVNPDDLSTIQEWSGYLLLADYRFHKLLWIYGEGRNGKGVWQRTMEAILGANNVSGIGLEEFNFSHRFALKQLYGKLFNPCSEPTTNYPLQTPLLKKATGQDTIDAEIKGKQTRVQFRNYAKITILANKFPKVEDTSTAFKERRLFIKFPNEFLGKDQIQNIEANWLTINDERSGILNWMLEGLKRLLTQGYFTESKTQQETEAQFLRASDTINAFLTEMVIFDRNLVTTRSKVYEAYKNYCDVLGLESESEKKFTQRLKDTPKISVCKIYKPKQERGWKGIGLNQIDDDGVILKNSTLSTLSTQKRLSIPSIYSTSENIGVYENSVFPVLSVLNSENKESESGVPAVPSVPSSESEPPVMRFQRVNPRVESHKCDNQKCENGQAVLSEFKQLLDDEAKRELGKEALYFCGGCFKKARLKAEGEGVVFVEVPMQELLDEEAEA